MAKDAEIGVSGLDEVAGTERHGDRDRDREPDRARSRQPGPDGDPQGSGHRTEEQSEPDDDAETPAQGDVADPVAVLRERPLG
ncbi:MAG: hypothetical protein H0U37_08360 [Chloroflexi bacterium]|nr:hypothetical protein [Chloroflexota bacterium]